jgi:hypothetical protein
MSVSHQKKICLTRCLGAVLLSASFLAAPPARAADFGDITVEATSLPSGGGTHGYIEYQFLITNRSTRDAHEVQLTLPRFQYSRAGHQLRSLSRTVRVAASRTVHMSLFQPALPIEGNGLQVAVDGRVQRTYKSVEKVEGREFQGRYRHSIQPNILVGQNIVPSELQGLVWRANTERAPQEERLLFVDNIRWVTVDAKNISSESWLAYSCYDGVALARDDLKALPAKVRFALERYVECGGSLLIVGPWQPPEHWRRTRSTPTTPLPKNQVTPFQTYYPGFGQCFVSSESDLRRVDPAPWRYIAESWGQTAKPLTEERSVTTANGDFPVVENVSTPVRGLFVVMLLFAVTIGPVNLYVLARTKRKIWMLWTVPAIALITSLAVLGYVYLREGWTGHERAEGLTILDELAGRATTVGWVGFYSPITPGDGLHFGYDTELSPQLGSEYGDYRRANRTVDWTNDQHLATGWVTARMPAHFMLRKTEARPERIEMRRAKGGKLMLKNGLGAAIRRLWYADSKGKIHTAANIPAGAPASLQAGGDEVVAEPRRRSLRQAFGMDWLEHYHEFTKHPELYLRPGCYLAALEDAPFIERGLRHGERKARSIVYGIHKEPADAR